MRENSIVLIPSFKVTSEVQCGPRSSIYLFNMGIKGYGDCVDKRTQAITEKISAILWLLLRCQIGSLWNFNQAKDT